MFDILIRLVLLLPPRFPLLLLPPQLLLGAARRRRCWDGISVFEVVVIVGGRKEGVEVVVGLVVEEEGRVMDL